MSRIAVLLLLLVPASARAVFHIAVIDEVMSGAGGNPNVQYVEIRTLTGGQNDVCHSRLTVFKCVADGGGFQVLIDNLGGASAVNPCLADSTAGHRWIMASPSAATFLAASGITPDFTWDNGVTGNIPTSCGMVCWGAPGTLTPPPNPPTWMAGDPTQYVDCVAYGPYDGTAEPLGNPAATDTPGNGTFSLTRTGDTMFSNNFHLACPTPTASGGTQTPGSFGACSPPTTTTTTTLPAGGADKCTSAKLKAVAKKEASLLKCQSKVAAKNDTTKLSTCEMKASGKFATAFGAAGACAGNQTACEDIADNCESTVAAAMTETFPSKCEAAKRKAAAKLASGELKCYSKAAAKGVPVDTVGCIPKAQSKFSAAIGAAGSCADGGSPQSLVENTCTKPAVETDGMGNVTGVCPPPTTSTTTTTTLPPGSKSLRFTPTAGTTSCGGAGLSPPPSCSPAACTGELDSDTSCTTKTNDLGLGCLYIGGGNAKTIPPGAIPYAGAAYYFNISGTNLLGSAGTGTLDCTKAAGPSKVCLNSDALPACTSDANCGGTVNGCFLRANCFFGPPLEFPNPATTSLTTCALNVVRIDASGTIDPTTGETNASLPLASEVYVTGNLGSPCPHCVGGSCTYGANALLPCANASNTLTSQDCPPERGLGLYQAPLPVNLSPLTTGTSTLTAADGNFCTEKRCRDNLALCTADSDCKCLNPPSCTNHAPCVAQQTPGALGNPSAQCVKETGSSPGDLTDGLAHFSILASAYCIPTTTNGTIDGVADLPGPGATSIPGNAQVVPTP